MLKINTVTMEEKIVEILNLQGLIFVSVPVYRRVSPVLAGGVDGAEPSNVSE